MNILMLTNVFTPHVGGVARSVEAFTEEYRKLGHRVLIVTPKFEDMPENEEGVLRVPSIQRFNGSDFSVPVPIPGFLNAALEEFKPDIVHSHHPFLLGDTALRVAAVRKLPVVFTHHTLYEWYTHYISDGSPTLQRFVADLVIGYCKLCDAVIAPSESIAAGLRAQGVDTRIRVVPTGVDIELFAAGDGRAFRTAHDIPADAFVVGHLGRLAPEKNLGFLAGAVATFLKAQRHAHFLVAGSGPAADDIEQLFTEHGVADRLHRVGQVQGQQLVNAYHAMDVFTFVSQSETQGMVLTEAMAAGVPVVAVDASGVREVVDDRHNGRLLATEDRAEFVAALEWIALLPASERRALRDAARQTAETFSMPRCAARALSLYESLLPGEHVHPDESDSLWATTLRLLDEEWKIMATKAKAVGAALLKPDSANELPR